MEEEELRKKIARIHTAILTHTPVGRDENDFPVAATQTYLYDFISQELDKAREEGRREGSEITSRYISDFVKSESGKSGRKEILEYIEELSKLKQ